ncbi:hypothetical protein A2U01_0057475, partial [Trifolium medium]|nr:hypothetical protein [Trifolium medium]
MLGSKGLTFTAYDSERDLAD